MSTDYRIILADGTVKHIHDIGHPVFNAAGKLVEFVGTTVDVTERKRAEEALHENTDGGGSCESRRNNGAAHGLDRP